MLDISDHDAELILELIDEFLKDAPIYLEELQKAAESGDQEPINQKAHRLKGLVANCGGEKMYKIINDIEKDARNEVFLSQELPLDLLNTELGHLKQALSDTDWHCLCQ